MKRFLTSREFMNTVLKTGPLYTREYQDSLPKFDRGISCLCWAYNEEEVIGKYLYRLNDLLSRYAEDYEIVIVDDGSTDRTNEIIRVAQKDIPQLRLVTNPVNLNVGLSCQRAVQSASKEFLFWHTADWSYDISLLRIFMEQLKTHDVVAGVRRKPTDHTNFNKRFSSFFKVFGLEHLRVRSDSFSKAIVSILNYYLIRFLFRFPLSDYQNVVFYRTSLIQSFKMENKSSFVNPEFLLKAWWSGASIAEVPISFIPRSAGMGKGVSFKTIKASITDIMGLWFKWIVLGKMQGRKKGSIQRLNAGDWEEVR